MILVIVVVIIYIFTYSYNALETKIAMLFCKMFQHTQAGSQNTNVDVFYCVQPRCCQNSVSHSFAHRSSKWYSNLALGHVGLFCTDGCRIFYAFRYKGLKQLNVLFLPYSQSSLLLSFPISHVMFSYLIGAYYQCRCVCKAVWNVGPSRRRRNMIKKPWHI